MGHRSAGRPPGLGEIPDGTGDPAARRSLFRRGDDGAHKWYEHDLATVASHLGFRLRIGHTAGGARRPSRGDEGTAGPSAIARGDPADTRWWAPVNGRVPGVAWYRFRSAFGRRWGGYLSVVLLIGLVGGIAMAAVAAGRRTQSSYPTFLASTNPSDMTVAVYNSATAG